MRNISINEIDRVVGGTAQAAGPAMALLGGAVGGAEIGAEIGVAGGPAGVIIGIGLGIGIGAVSSFMVYALTR